MAELSDVQELARYVRSFLHDFKELMGQGCYRIEFHIKNLQALADLGITARQRDECILSLALDNYSSGPRPDEFHPGQNFWVFGAALEGAEIYIKLKIVPTGKDNEMAVCISFHRAEFPLPYPFRESSRK